MKYIILAGGTGKRLFPLSRKKKPKQFLKLFSDNTLIQETVLRLNSNKFKIVSSKKNFYKLKDNLKEINKYKKNRILLEPFGKNTAPAIIYALTQFEENDIIAVLPSDHYIKDNKKFDDCLKNAGEIADKGYIVTLGIVPQYPETGYGYIKKSRKLNDNSFLVEKFVEKPDLKTANKYLESNNYYWNAGMFVFKKKTFISELKKIDRELYDFYKKIKKNPETKNEEYKKIKNISIDYAVMEKTDKMAVVESQFGWNDIGNWKSLKDILGKNNENVVKNTKEVSLKSKNNLVISEKPIVSLIDINDLAVIDTKDILLLADLKNSQKVKTIFNKIDKIAPFRTEASPDEERPWGKFESLKDDEETGYKVKWIKVKKGEKLSLQYHKKRAEHWIIVSGKGLMTLGKNSFVVEPGQYIHIPVEEKHTMKGIENTEFIEIQTGNYLKEDDIVRLEDKYNR